MLAPAGFVQTYDPVVLVFDPLRLTSKQLQTLFHAVSWLALSLSLSLSQRSVLFPIFHFSALAALSLSLSFLLPSLVSALDPRSLLSAVTHSPTILPLLTLP